MAVAVDILPSVPFVLHVLFVCLAYSSNFGAGIVSINMQSAMVRWFEVLTSSAHAPKPESL